jgi:hypothetical protein
MTLRERIEKHKAVEELYEDSDGYWANLKDGFTHFGACAIHEETLTKLVRQLPLIVKTEPTAR